MHVSQFPRPRPAIKHPPVTPDHIDSGPGPPQADFVPPHNRSHPARDFPNYNKLSSIAIRAIMFPRGVVFQAGNSLIGL